MDIKVKNRRMDLMQPSALFVYCMGMDDILVCAWGGVRLDFFLLFFFSFASHAPCFNVAFTQNKNRNSLPWK